MEMLLADGGIYATLQVGRTATHTFTPAVSNLIQHQDMSRLLPVCLICLQTCCFAALGCWQPCQQPGDGGKLPARV